MTEVPQETTGASVRRIAGADGLALVADAYGEAPWDVILLHGGGQTRGAWGRTPERFHALGYSVLNVDLRGHGESDWDREGRYSFRSHAADLLAYGDPDHPAIVIGASLGGVTALGAALRAPERFRAIALVDIAPTMQRSGVARIVGFMQAYPDGFANLDDARKAIEAYLPHRKGRTSGSLQRNLRLSPETGRWMWHWDPRTLDFATEDWYQRQTADMAAAVSRLDVPVILVRGEHSDVILDEDVDRFLALGDHTSHVEVPDARHMVAGDENDVFLNQILAALERSVEGFRYAS